MNVAVARFGIGEDQGVLVAASRSDDFPNEQDRLLLGVGANQTAVVLQRRRAEEEVHAQREWLRITLASIGDAVVTTDTEGQVTFLNSVAQELTGWTTEDAQGQPLESVFVILHEQMRTAGREPGRARVAGGRRCRSGQPHGSDLQGWNRTADRRFRSADSRRERQSDRRRPYFPGGDRATPSGATPQCAAGSYASLKRCGDDRQRNQRLSCKRFARISTGT